jgi:DnaJ-class molecular chaperone
MANGTPKVGQKVTMRGIEVEVIAILPMGTIEVQAEDGRAWRISGLDLSAPKTTNCRRCKGTGTASVNRYSAGRAVACYVQCPKCAGSGKVAK